MKVFTPLVLLAALATAAPSPQSISQCNTGSMVCCNSVQSSQSSPVASLLGLLGIAVGSVGAQVGLGCTPITVIGVGGSTCTAQAVCCTGNAFGGLINLGCNAINL